MGWRVRQGTVRGSAPAPWVTLGLVLTGSVLAGVIAGCGTSVADVDRGITAPVRTAAPAPLCASAQANAAALAQLSAVTQTATVAPDRLAAAVDAVRRTDADLLTNAPAELTTDLSRTVDVLGVELDALVRARGNGATAARDPAVSAATSDPAVATSAHRVSAYVARTCSGGS